MPRWYDHYQQGFYQEVYDELLAMKEHVFDDHVYDDALLVMRDIMRRVRSNIERGSFRVFMPSDTSLAKVFGANLMISLLRKRRR